MIGLVISLIGLKSPFSHFPWSTQWLRCVIGAGPAGLTTLKQLQDRCAGLQKWEPNVIYFEVGVEPRIGVFKKFTPQNGWWK